MNNGKAYRKSFCISAGHKLLAVCIGSLVVGHGVLAIFFPDLKGRGLDSTALSILIPIWSLGALGLLLLFCGWIRHPTIAPKLSLPYSRRHDGRYIGPVLCVLGAFASLLMAACMVFLFISEYSENPSLKEVVVSYSVLSLSLFLFYLCTFYSERQDPVTTTYLNIFLVFFAILLIPILWPILAVLCFAHNRKTRQSS